MEGTVIDNLFAAADIAGVQTNVVTLSTAFIAINVIFLAVYYLKKTMNRNK